MQTLQQAATLQTLRWPAKEDTRSSRHTASGRPPTRRHRGPHPSPMHRMGASWLPLEPCDACSYLGLGFNGLDVIPRDIGLAFPSLRALDLSFNSLCNLDGVTEALGSLLRIEFLTLTGNPLTILPNYRRRVAYALPGLKQLDGNYLRYHWWCCCCWSLVTVCGPRACKHEGIPACTHAHPQSCE